MRIDVIGRHLEISDPIREHAEQKTAKLLKLFDGTQLITVTIEPVHNEFKVELIVDVVKHDDFVSSATGTDVYGVIDQAVDKAWRQLRDFKEKLRVH